MDQVQNFVQPCPERDFARGALSLKEEWKGGKRCGAALRGKGGAGPGFELGTEGRAARNYLTEVHPGQQCVLHLAVLSCGMIEEASGPGRGPGVGHRVGAGQGRQRLRDKRTVPNSLFLSMLSCSEPRPRPMYEENCQLRTGSSKLQGALGGWQKNWRFWGEEGGEPTQKQAFPSSPHPPLLLTQAPPFPT